jgi:hypothetical protein
MVDRQPEIYRTETSPNYRGSISEIRTLAKKLFLFNISLSLSGNNKIIMIMNVFKRYNCIQTSILRISRSPVMILATVKN